jgi:hypothetical protein
MCRDNDWLHLIKAPRHDSAPSDGLHSSIIRTKIKTTPRVQPDVSPRCSRRMRYVCSGKPSTPLSSDLRQSISPPR